MRSSNSIGFTGTQRGMTEGQLSQLASLLLFLQPDVFHHGDCIGADEQAHYLVKKILPDCQIIIHPPVIPEKRAYCGFKEESKKFRHPTQEDASLIILSPMSYLVRNYEIVDTSAMLMATPGERVEVLRSGTWATVRYAVKSNKPVELILP